MKKLLLTIIWSLASIIILANDKLTEDEKKAITNQIEHVVDAFTTHLEYIADKKDSDEELKDYHIEASMDLFIGRGEKSYDKDGNVKIPAPLIQVSNAYSQSITSYLIRPYLQTVKHMKYTQVTYKNSKAYVVSDLKPTGRDCEYTTTLAVLQLFIGDKGDGVKYVDTTDKIYNVYVFCTRSGNGVIRWNVKIGDVTVQQTQIGNHYNQ